MQLFICSFLKKGQTIGIENKEVVNQVRKVLRGKIGDTISIQAPSFSCENQKRYTIRITHLGKTELEGEIITTADAPKTSGYRSLLVAIPNKRKKSELIVQKLSEIGIDEIIFFPAERSVIKQPNENKVKRMLVIAKEASEQAWRWTLPTITFVEKEKISSLITKSTHTIVFDIPSHNIAISGIPEKKYQHIIGIIGPEGGLTPQDYSYFGNNYEIQHLGNTVMRMETASIIAGWKITMMQ